jgi:hypothetical protein
MRMYHPDAYAQISSDLAFWNPETGPQKECGEAHFELGMIFKGMTGKCGPDGLDHLKRQ